MTFGTDEHIKSGVWAQPPQPYSIWRQRTGAQKLVQVLFTARDTKLYGAIEADYVTVVSVELSAGGERVCDEDRLVQTTGRRVRIRADQLVHNWMPSEFRRRVARLVETPLSAGYHRNAGLSASPKAICVRDWKHRPCGQRFDMHERDDAPFSHFHVLCDGRRVQL